MRHRLTIQPKERATSSFFSELTDVVLWFFPFGKYRSKLQDFGEALTKQADTRSEAIRVTFVYWIDADRLHVHLKTKGLIQDKLRLAQQLSDSLALRSDEVREEVGGLFTTFYLKDEEKITVSTLEDFQRSDTLEVRLSSQQTWELAKQPMGLVVGGTGSGKTVFLKALALGFLENSRKNNLYVIDGKDAYLGQTVAKNWRKSNVATTAERAIRLLSHLNNLMNTRFERVKAAGVDDTYVNIFSGGAVLLIVDELLALVSLTKAEDKQKKPAERLTDKMLALLQALVIKGRQANVHVVISGQQLSAEIVPTSLRDSLGLRVALGRMTQVQAQEVFDVGLKDLPPVDVANHGGLVYLDGKGWQTPRAFLPLYAELDFGDGLKTLRERKTKKNG